VAAQWDVIGVGANSLDFVYRLPRRPGFEGEGAKIPIGSRAIWCGGQAATTLATCAALGLRTKYIGAVGNDDHGARMRAELTRRGIDVSDVVTCACENAYAVILVDEPSGERIVLWHRSDALSLDTTMLAPARLGSARLIHVDDVDQAAAIAAAEAGRALDCHVTSDIDRITDRTEELVGAVTVAIFAEHVPEALTGERDFERALRKLRKRHDGILCVTLGRRGAILLHGDRLSSAPALDVAAVDTTAAGDIFRGAFIHALLSGVSPDRILSYANAAAGLSCTRPGAMNSVPTAAELASFVNSKVDFHVEGSNPC
jgi:sugar/nucleoside kinase (ribokinase family)